MSAPDPGHFSPPNHHKNPNGGVDPFAPTLAHESKSWLWATGLQALFTCGLLALEKFMEGRAWEHQARMIVVLGIVATWGLALRTIRERLVELMRYWQKASQGLLRRASESGMHWIAVPMQDSQEKYIKAAIWRLRIIAAGLTIPFFVMPVACSLIAVIFSFELKPAAMHEYWSSFAIFTMFSAYVVAAYFHWVIVALPAPVPVRVSGSYGRHFLHRKRPGKIRISNFESRNKFEE